MLTIKGMIFDLDGTLVDTLDDLTNSMNFALDGLGFEVRPREECRKMIGHGLNTFAERALGAENLSSRDRLLEVMTVHYRNNCLYLTRPYPGLEEVIVQLNRQGIRLGILTNKNQEPAEKITNHFFGIGMFDPILGCKQGRKFKPDPNGIHEILNTWQLTASEVVLIGDSEVDIQTATAAGVLAVGAAWGFRSRNELVQAGADKIIEHPTQILRLLD